MTFNRGLLKLIAPPFCVVTMTKYVHYLRNRTIYEDNQKQYPYKTIFYK